MTIEKPNLENLRAFTEVFFGNHWKKEKITFDAIYTGYIGDARQFDIILDIKNNLLKNNGLFIVDPAMADNGNMYYGLGENIIKGMKKICSKADYILPNITEASFLTDTPYQEKQSSTSKILTLYHLNI